MEPGWYHMPCQKVTLEFDFSVVANHSIVNIVRGRERGWGRIRIKGEGPDCIMRCRGMEEGGG